MAGSANITSTDAVRAFKLALERYEGDVRDSVSQMELELRRAVDWIEHDRARALANQLTALTATWRDQEQKKFAVQFEEGMKMVSRFLENNDRHVPYLLRKAEHIDEYLKS